MAVLTDYLDEKTLRMVQEAFSAVAGRGVLICAEDGAPLLPAVDPASTSPAPAAEDSQEDLLEWKRRQLDQTAGDPLDLPIILDEEIAGRVRFAPEDAPQVQQIAEPIRNNLLRLLATVLVKLCKDAEALRSRVEDLVTLYRLTAEFTGHRDLQEVLDLVVKTVVETMQVKACAIRLLDAETNELVIKSVTSFSPQYLYKDPIPLSKSKLDQESLETGEPVYVEDMTTDPRVLYPEEAKREGIVSGLIAPMIYKGRYEGVLRVFMGEHYEFSWFDRQLFKTIASAAASAIANARLIEEAAHTWEIKRQIALAGVVQRRMIPSEPPSIPGFDLAAIYIPSQQLSGDFYDFIELPENNWGMAICDVSGKGIRSSLLTASIRASLRAHAMNVYEMMDVLNLVNRDLCADTLSQDFATMFYGVLNTETRDFTYACAGHMPPILVRDGQVCELGTSGGILGLLPEMSFPRDTMKVLPGDVILTYTDGLSEAMNFADEGYGRHRIEQAALEGVRQGYSAQGVARYVVWDMRRFAGLHTRLDDLTLIVLRVL